ncbi:hypothetical protein H4S08_004626, partial [Coemansia sp. RSA 1365]
MRDQQETINYLVEEVAKLKEKQATMQADYDASLILIEKKFEQELDKLRRQLVAPQISTPFPEFFHGQPHKVESFLHSLTVYFYALSATFIYERDKVAFAATLMRGDAIIWTQLRIGPNAQIPLPKTFNEYCQSIRKIFGGSDYKAN